MNTISKIQVKRYRRIALPSEFKIRKKTFRIIKFLLLVLFTGFITFVTYNLMITYFPKHKIASQRMMMSREDSNYKNTQFITKISKPKIDWHDYDQIKEEKQRTGPAEQGEAANFSHINKDLLNKLYKENGYNGALSDIISLHRALPDVRPPNCSNVLYKRNLPHASIIIPFHNEHFSVLLRTAWSVTKRSPEQLIKDIILVDDFSTKEFLKYDLDDYLKKNLPKAKVVRLKRRSGLIVARQEGAKAAQGQVLIFLDAHCEANVNWLPPLLDIISDDYKICVCPFIDIIDYDTYKYTADAGGRGAFNWDLVYQRLYKFKRYGELSIEPFESPVMAGGLFAISAEFFWELGGYDEGLFIWGGEQFEISFKIWQCGGRLLDVPCSRVGHMYRKFGAFENPDNNVDYLCMNYRRVAEVWMDEYKEYYYKRHLDCANKTYGDISKQVAIRKKLKCKPFKWFMEEVAYDVTNRYPIVDPPDVAYGEIRNVGNPDFCVETTDKDVQISMCSMESWSQKNQFTWRGEIKRKYSDDCWDVGPQTNDKSRVILYACHYGAGNQLWKYNEKTKNLINENSGKCLELETNPTVILFISPCKEGETSQQWILENFNQSQHDRIPEFLNKIIIDGK